MNRKSLSENYFPESDKSNRYELNDTRRPRLTLRHLNKLRKIREMRRLEMAAHKEFVQTMYGGGEDEEGGMPGF